MQGFTDFMDNYTMVSGMFENFRKKDRGKSPNLPVRVEWNKKAIGGIDVMLTHKLLSDILGTKLNSYRTN